MDMQSKFKFLVALVTRALRTLLRHPRWLLCYFCSHLRNRSLKNFERDTVSREEHHIESKSLNFRNASPKGHGYLDETVTSELYCILRLEKNMDLVDVILPYASELLDEASVKFFDKCVSKAHLEKNQTCKRMRRKCSLISVCIVIPHNWRVFWSPAFSITCHMRCEI